MSQPPSSLPSPHARILVNYQHDDAEAHVHRLVRMLRRRFGGDSVETCVDIPSGETPAPRGVTSQREVLLVVVGRRWRPPSGGPLSEQSYRKPPAKGASASPLYAARELIVVLVDGASLLGAGASKGAPEIKRLASHEVPLRDERWEKDFEELAAQIERSRAAGGKGGGDKGQNKKYPHKDGSSFVGVVFSRACAIELLTALSLALGHPPKQKKYKKDKKGKDGKDNKGDKGYGGGYKGYKIGGGSKTGGGTKVGGGTKTGGGTKYGGGLTYGGWVKDGGGKGGAAFRPARARAGVLTEEVCCTAFAPPQVAPGAQFMVQVFAHLPEDEVKASALATEFDEGAKRRGTRTLESEVARGTRLTFQLSLPGLSVDEPLKSLTWRGRPESVQFPVSVPGTQPPGNVLGLVEVRAEGVPFGDFSFQVRVEEKTATATDTAPAPPRPEATGTWVQFRKAFISYASADRGEVMIGTQMLEEMGIDYFQDILKLDPGDRWEQQLYKHIDESDLFLLFWTEAARQSEWVLREARYALDRQKRGGSGRPAIKPMFLDGSPPPMPPTDLAHIHFDSSLRVYMTVRKSRAGGSPKRGGAKDHPKVKGPSSR